MEIRFPLLGLLKNRLILILLFCVLGKAQSLAFYLPSSPATSTSFDTSLDTSNQKDVVDLIESVFRTHIRKPGDTAQVKPGKLLFAVVPGIGYSLQTNFDVVTTMNVSFYNGPAKSTNLSAVTLIPEYAPITHQIIVPIAYNVWTSGNTWNWVGDMRYYKYPNYTYGLGPNSNLNTSDLIDYSYIRMYQVIMRHLVSKFYAGIGYELDYHWDIKPETDVTGFQLYNQNRTATTSSGWAINLTYDERTNQNNPGPGFFANLTYRVNQQLLGSDQNWQSLQAEFREYLHPFKNKKAILAFWSWNCLTFGGNAPYFDLPSTGWDTYSNMARGYIQGRLRGPGLLYLESEYRFNILRSGLLGGVVFVNAQSVAQWPNPNSLQFTNVLPGEGVGLRFKLNKLSNVNFSLDYGMGTQGSNGFFLNIAEVF